MLEFNQSEYHLQKSIFKTRDCASYSIITSFLVFCTLPQSITMVPSCKVPSFLYLIKSDVFRLRFIDPDRRESEHGIQGGV
jgi:hypothetical protein